MKFSIEEFRAISVVSVRHCGGGFAEIAPSAWRALWTWINQHQLGRSVRRAIGFGHIDPTQAPAARCSYTACLEVQGELPPELAADITLQTVPGGTYAVYRMQGSYQAMPAAFQDLRHEWLPAAGLEIDLERPFLEIYLNDPSEAAESDLLTDLCVPVLA